VGSARVILGIVGAVVGAFFGQAAGASLGFAIGSTIGAIIDGPLQIPGPGLSEAPIQTSRDGIPIPIIWGLHSCAGNILMKNPETTIDFTISQGKGGGTETIETHRYRTYAIGVCRAPIHEITRIWENEKLVYDIRAVPAIPIAETVEYAIDLRFYSGDESQLPDPDLESHWGIGATPAFRGLAYIVWVNKDLTGVGGAIPQYRFEVNGSKDVTVTSKPYPADAGEGLAPTISFPNSWVSDWPIEAIESTSVPVGGDYAQALTSYSYIEAIETETTPVEGDLGDALTSYAYVEAIETTTTPVEGDLGIALIVYSYVEAIETTTIPEDSTLI